MSCARGRGWTFEVIADLGPGMGDDKNGVKRPLHAIFVGELG